LPRMEDAPGKTKQGAKKLGVIARWPWLAGLVLFLAAAWIPYRTNSPTGDIASIFNDHIRHAYTSHVFLKKGFELYRVPLNVSTADVAYPHAQHNWGHMPLAYPPGQIGLFMPMALLGHYVAMPTNIFGKWTVAYLLLFTCLGLVAWLKCLALGPPGFRLVLGLITVPEFLHLSLSGFYDPIWLGCGAMVVLRLTQDRPMSALRWFAGAAFLHYRAVILLPLGILAAWRAWHQRPFKKGDWATVAWCAFAFALVLVSFYWMYPVTAAQRATAPPLSLRIGTHSPMQTAIGISTLVMVVLAARRQWLALGTVMVGTAIALSDFQGYEGYWHHAGAILPVLLVPMVQKFHAPSALATQAIAVFWIIALQSVVWLVNPVSFWLTFFHRFIPAL